MVIRIDLTLQSVCTPQDLRNVVHHLGEHHSRTSTFLTRLPPSGVAYGTTHTLGIMIRVAGKPIGILLTMLLGLNPVHLSSHRTGLVRTSSTERHPPSFQAHGVHV
jgi:hypothetical protein